MLTTFNEVDMSAVMELRNKYKDKFKEEKGVSLGFMSFFTKAVTEALRLFPNVNAQIDGEEMIMHDYADIGIAVSSPKGLMVPVLRNAETHELGRDRKRGSRHLAIKARDGKLSIDEMTGGTFTITNGGVFGSMLSTPIMNPPQSAILGMHNIVDRPMAVNGQVVIRPVMYLALSYDHRIIDGKESVSFLMASEADDRGPEQDGLRRTRSRGRCCWGCRGPTGDPAVGHSLFDRPRARDLFRIVPINDPKPPEGQNGRPFPIGPTS